MTTIAANLRDRIKEAESQGWLGEVEGLQTSLAAAETKLAQMDQMSRRAGVTAMPMPVIRLGAR